MRKNLLENTATSQTKSGVTITVNEDGSAIFNGTATSTIFFTVNIITFIADDSYIISGCPKSGSAQTFFVKIELDDDTSTFYTDMGKEVRITPSITAKYRYTIRIASGYTCDNLTFYPMIRKATIEDDTYEPYFSDTELDITLPAISTLAGTNTLTVGTEVQPSGVEIKGRIKAAGGD